MFRSLKFLAYDPPKTTRSSSSGISKTDQLPDFDFTRDDESLLSQEIVVEDGNQILKHFSGDGHAFYETDADWNNYLVNLRWKFGGWGDTNILDYAYDNFTIYVMTNLAGDERPTNPGSYQVILRRNKNGSGDFPAGTPYFEICKPHPVERCFPGSRGLARRL